jgi:uncharacterized membrane protein YphA (DoxX/SURF4 family)
MQSATASKTDTKTRMGTSRGALPHTSIGADNRDVTRANVLLWTVQGVLALIFLFAGGTKLVLPVEEMTKQMELPGPFLRFIGVCEVLGALGLILPGLLRFRPIVTPLAAAGLVIIMAGATVLTLALGDGVAALMPLVVGILAAVVAYGRWRVAPYRRPFHAAVVRQAGSVLGQRSSSHG